MTQSARRDYYEVLGVTPDANDEAIRRAFRASARRVHPDVSDAADAEERFRELAEAYSVLSRSTSRLLYDRLGYRGRGHGGFAPFTRHARRRAEEEARRAAGVAAEVTVASAEAARGTTAAARLTGSVTCAACGGRGSGASEAGRCASCHGTGRLRRAASAEFGRILQIERCHRCAGTGLAAPLCRSCGGSGRRVLRGEALVTIPAGTRDGTRIALADGGEVLVRVAGKRRDDRAVRLAALAGLAVGIALLVLVLFA